MEENPWQVESIHAFYCLKCPECHFTTKEESGFIHHAKDNHPLSNVLFEKESFNEIGTFQTTITIKEEMPSDFLGFSFHNALFFQSISG